MHQGEKEIAEKNYVRVMKRKDIIRRKTYYLFGVSNPTRRFIAFMRKNYNIEPKYVLDNDVKKVGTDCSGIEVVSVETAVKTYVKHEDIFIIESPFWQEMKNQLISLGVDIKDIFSIREEYRKTSFVDCRAYLNYLKGKRVYRKIVQTYGEKTMIFICPYSGTGDIYLIGLFFDKYLKYNGIKDYVFIVPSNACKKVANMFEIQNVLVYDYLSKLKYLFHYYRIVDPQNLKILNDGWRDLWKIPTLWIRGYKGYNFERMFRRFVFELPDEIEITHPKIKYDSDVLAKFIDYKKIEKGKTVILSPYSNTIPVVDSYIWEEVAQDLITMGYKVFTNSSGDHEPAVKGTEALQFDFVYANELIEYAGGFIGARSGFCDIVSGCKAKKVIIYNKDVFFFNSTVYDYFSLNGMGLCDDAIELNIDFSEDSSNIVQMIIDPFEM